MMRKNRYSRNDILLFFICLLVGSMIIGRDVIGVSLNKYILLSACVFGMPFLSYSNFLGLLGFLFALTFGIPSTYIFTFAVVVLVLKKSNELNKATIAIFILFFVLELILSVVYNSEFNINTYIGYFSRLFLFFILIKENSNRVDFINISKYFTVGVLVFVSVVLAMYLKNNSFLDIFNGLNRIGDTSLYLFIDSTQEGMKMSTNPNYVAYYCLVGMGCCVTFYHLEKKYFWLLLLFIIFFMGSLTLSKTFFFLSALLFVFLVFLTLRGKLSFGKKFFGLIVICFVIYEFLKTEIFIALLNRFENVEYLFQDSRTTILKGYMEAFLSRLGIFLFGAGAFTQRQILSPSVSVHSGLAQILFAYGVFGFLIFVGYCLYELYIINKYREVITISERISVATPIIAVILFTQTIQFINPVDLMFPYLIGMFVLRGNYVSKRK